MCLVEPETRGQAVVKTFGGESDSDFEIEVSDRLRDKGYQVVRQVGVSGYKIDLGIRHPDHLGMFLAGVECDGASYHSSKSALPPRLVTPAPDLAA
jgi:hypothetical protein